MKSYTEYLTFETRKRKEMVQIFYGKAMCSVAKNWRIRRVTVSF